MLAEKLVMRKVGAMASKMVAQMDSLMAYISVALKGSESVQRTVGSSVHLEVAVKALRTA